MKPILAAIILTVTTLGGLYLIILGALGVYFNNTFLDYIVLALGVVTISAIAKGYINN